MSISIYGWLILLGAGCANTQEEPIWEKTKITDLAPPAQKKEPGGLLIKTIDFQAFIFELPAEKITDLAEIADSLSSGPIKLAEENAFEQNSFSIALGHYGLWQPTLAGLGNIEAEKLKTVSLLISSRRKEDLAARRVRNQRLLYASSQDNIEEVTLGAGWLALRMSAKKLPRAPGYCSLTAAPVFSIPVTTPIAELEKIVKSREISFDSAGFTVRMRPGDFFMLAPTGAWGKNPTLGNLFFGKPGVDSVVRFYLIACTRINY